MKEDKPRELIMVALVVAIVVLASFLGAFISVTSTRMSNLEREVSSKGSSINNLTNNMKNLTDNITQLDNVSRLLEEELASAGNNTSLLNYELKVMKISYGVHIMEIAYNQSITVPAYTNISIGSWLKQGNNTLFYCSLCNAPTNGATGGFKNNNTTECLNIRLNTPLRSSETGFGVLTFLAESLEVTFNNTSDTSASFSYSMFLLWEN